MEDITIDRENIRNFQKNSLGRIKGNNLLLELLPLPHKSITNWDYQSIKLPHFDTRKNYLKFYLPERIKRIKELITRFNPKVVVFYSTSYMESWKDIMGIDKNISIECPFIKKINSTIFIVCKHPAAHGITNEYYPKIGANVRKLL